VYQWLQLLVDRNGWQTSVKILLATNISSTYGHSQLKTGHPVRSAIHKQLNGRLVLWWVTTWESLLLYVLLSSILPATHSLREEPMRAKNKLTDKSSIIKARVNIYEASKESLQDERD
jgi:hypothetical protein